MEEYKVYKNVMEADFFVSHQTAEYMYIVDLDARSKSVSYKYIKALEKKIAIDTFNQLNAKKYTIFSSNIKSTGIICESNLLPSYKEFAKTKTSFPELSDLYICMYYSLMDNLLKPYLSVNICWINL